MMRKIAYGEVMVRPLAEDDFGFARESGRKLREEEGLAPKDIVAASWFSWALCEDEDDYAAWVAIRQGKPVGYIGATVNSKNDDYYAIHGFIYHLYVLESARRTGCGRRLLEVAESWLVEKGCLSVRLTTIMPIDAPAHQLFARKGYDQCGVNMLGVKLANGDVGPIWEYEKLLVAKAVSTPHAPAAPSR